MQSKLDSGRHYLEILTFIINLNKYIKQGEPSRAENCLCDKKAEHKRYFVTFCGGNQK
jgi:hypothetical protein